LIRTDSNRGNGPDKPIADNITEQGRAENSVLNSAFRQLIKKLNYKGDNYSPLLFNHKK
jgi:hypothetical protein